MKKRYCFNEDESLIRVNQGHSILIDIELETKTPSEVFWYGKSKKYVNLIDKQGIIPESRLFVHLSSDYDTAIKVGSRHGSLVNYKMDETMERDGYIGILWICNK